MAFDRDCCFFATGEYLISVVRAIVSRGGGQERRLSSLRAGSRLWWCCPGRKLSRNGSL